VQGNLTAFRRALPEQLYGSIEDPDNPLDVNPTATTVPASIARRSASSLARPAMTGGTGALAIIFSASLCHFIVNMQHENILKEMIASSSLGLRFIN
jgi:hypothetical protein